jgi:hypothetical protein
MLIQNYSKASDNTLEVIYCAHIPSDDFVYR